MELKFVNIGFDGGRKAGGLVENLRSKKGTKNTLSRPTLNMATTGIEPGRYWWDLSALTLRHYGVRKHHSSVLRMRRDVSVFDNATWDPVFKPLHAGQCFQIHAFSIVFSSLDGKQKQRIQIM